MNPNDVCSTTRKTIFDPPIPQSVNLPALFIVYLLQRAGFALGCED